jgi:hypothetical protein
MIADQVLEIAQPRRLGNLLEDKIQGAYLLPRRRQSRNRLLQALEDRWNKPVVNSPDSPRWRASAQP